MSRWEDGKVPPWGRCFRVYGDSAQVGSRGAAGVLPHGSDQREADGGGDKGGTKCVDKKDATLKIISFDFFDIHQSLLCECS